MEKRLSQSDYLFIIAFVFMLFVSVGGFFIGHEMGVTKTEEKFKPLLEDKAERDRGYDAYHQQLLVSFYHSVFQPYREFNKAWFDKLNDLEHDGNKSSDPSSIIRSLSKLAQSKYKEVSEKTMPDHSPLLQSGIQNYAKSLKLFYEALDTLQPKANSIRPSDLVKLLQQDAYLGEAKNFALLAQRDYYDSIMKWVETNNPNVKNIDPTRPLSLKDWSALNVNVKNDYLAYLMVKNNMFSEFMPQDLTSRIDDMIYSGQAKKMGMTELQQIIDLLVGTNAVRTGDFVRAKGRNYPDDKFPQIPFFFSQY